LLVPLQIDITPERVLTVSGERKTDLCTGWDERSQERHFGQFEGLFALADDADTSTINANLKLGVLTVTVKKKKMVKGQRVEVTID
jgi:HSP20 family protein